MWDFQALRPDLVIIGKKRRIVKLLILHFLEIRRLRKRRLRNRKVSRSKKGVLKIILVVGSLGAILNSFMID